ncbi:unnamed protein product [Arabidopsis halleri]
MPVYNFVAEDSCIVIVMLALMYCVVQLLCLEVGDYDDDVKTCQNCSNVVDEFALGFIKCNYFLDFRCASLPLTVKLPMYDDHALTLCYGEKANDKYWCDICERETNPGTWFYTCNDCGVTLHILCVLGNVRYAKPEEKIKYGIALAFNKTFSRPICKKLSLSLPGSLLYY